MGEHDLPENLYRAAEVRELDRTAIEALDIPGYVLMRRAGRAVFEWARERWPRAGRWLVVAGPGNNGGDGYVVARLAHQAGLDVRVVQAGDPQRLRGDAARARSDYLVLGGRETAWDGQRLPEVDLLVDALLGTGLERPLSGSFLALVRAINAHPAPVLAVDIPSGLHADTGAVLGDAVQAKGTLSFIGLKQGLFTGQAPDYTGPVRFDDLGVPPETYDAVAPGARLLRWRRCRGLAPRPRTAHKGHFGHVLVVGGDLGLAGAARLASEAALRTGAGLVSLATREAHAPAIAAARPEVMARGVERPEGLDALLERATVLAVGPGFGRGPWGRALFRRLLEVDLPMVLDADGLNLLAEAPRGRSDWVLTPHPGEAARLLGTTSEVVQQDRFAAAEELAQRYGGVVVLKGAGTVVAGDGAIPAVCAGGNPGMASGGMGDVLTGLVAGLLAQGMTPRAAAELAVCLHAEAGDRAAARGGERGLLASDLLIRVRRLVSAHA